MFPSAGKTPFGEWVKAGALKQGDTVSTPASVTNAAMVKANGETVAAANDNGPLTVAEIVRENRSARVYNFEVESRPGEVTNNYFVGDQQAWVHNSKGQAWESIFKDPNTSKAIKGWIQQELNRGRKFWNLKNPPGCDLGHFPANRGAHGTTSRPEWATDNRRRPSITGNNPKWR